MKLEEAKSVIEKWSGWNNGQTSVSLASGGPRTTEDDILDERRQLVLNAYRIVRKHSEAAHD